MTIRAVLRPWVIVLATACTLTLAILGGASIASALTSSSPEIPPASLSVGAVDEFPVTDGGLSYGYVDQGLRTDPSARADLVAVTTDAGQEGWAYFAELMPAHVATTPEEARRLSTDEPYAVAVYELDGQTLIGYQTVNRPAG